MRFSLKLIAHHILASIRREVLPPGAEPLDDALVVAADDLLLPAPVLVPELGLAPRALLVLDPEDVLKYLETRNKKGYVIGNYSRHATPTNRVMMRKE